MGINDNTLNKQDTQKRILLATLLSFAFFIAYDFLYIQPQQEHAQALQKAKQTNSINAKHQTPQVDTKIAPTSDTKDAKIATAPDTKSVDKRDIISTIVTQHNEFQIDKLGRIAQVTLDDLQYKTKDGKKIKLFTAKQLKPLEVRFSDEKLNTEAFTTPVVASSSKLDVTKSATVLTLTQKLSKVVVTKNIKFFPDGHYHITIDVTNNEPYFITNGYRPNVITDQMTVHGVLLYKNDGTTEVIKDGKADKTTNYVGIKVASSFDRYYATVLYNMKRSMELSIMPDKDENPQVFIHGKGKLELDGYAGPKEYNTLHKLDPQLTKVIEYGWFTFISKPMFHILQFIYSYIGNWGWTIVIVTILIKLILYPLSYKGMVSMNKLKELAPKIKQIQEKYKGDKQKSSMHMMELYKKEGANPMGGCLPIMLQIPIFFSLYRVLLNAIELKGAPWILWIHDLAAMDPYYVLPILMGITMFVQQKITPNQIQDETQKKMFMALPVIFTIFFLWFPAGLTLYWFVNNLFTVGQQYYINKLFEAKKALKHKEHLEHKHKK
jgi:YidC/Oxa1 family membrane protein insertase